MKVTPSALALDAEFGRSDGRSHHLRFKDFDSTKNGDEIRAAMSKLTKLSIFDKNDVSLFDEVRHATVIEKRERGIFDNKEDAKKKADETLIATPVMAESVPVEPAQVKSEPTTQAQEPVKHIEAIRIPEDLTIMIEYPKPGRLIETIELPLGVDPRDISESDAYRLIASCLPPHVSVENLEVDEQTTPVRLIITGTFEDEEPPIKQVIAVNKESPPEKNKKKRKRLLERVRKRE